MNVRRYFVYDDTHDSGMDGWSSMFIPKSARFTPNQGRGLMHDALEHGLGEDGSFAYEAMAFGRIMALRAQPGVIPGVKGLGAELFSLWEHDADMQEFSAPRVGRLDECADDINEIVAEFAAAERSARRDKYADPESFFTGSTHHTALASLLQIGYRDALRRYPNCFRLGWACAEFFEKDKRIYGEPGDVLALTIDTSRFEIKHRVYSGEKLPQWAEDRVRAWNWT